MTKSHFDIERGKRITIQIPGYDADKESRRIKDRLVKKWKSAKLKDANARQELRKKIIVTAATDTDIDELNSSLSSHNPFAAALVGEDALRGADTHVKATSCES